MCMEFHPCYYSPPRKKSWGSLQSFSPALSMAKRYRLDEIIYQLKFQKCQKEQQQGKQVKTIYEKTYQLKFKFHSIVFKCFQCIYETFVKGQLLNVINISIYFKFSRQVYKTIKIFDANCHILYLSPTHPRRGCNLFHRV